MSNDKASTLRRPGAAGNAAKSAPRPGMPGGRGMETAFGRPRNSLNNRFVYAVISQRARGLSIGVNLNPDQGCNFNCVYCEVDRDNPGKGKRVDVRGMAQELESLLGVVAEGGLRRFAWFRTVPSELLELKEVALSGDGEPTLCPNFKEVVHEVLYIRSRARFAHFKIVLITNGTALDVLEVGQAVRRLTNEDEVWIKLDAGTQRHMNQVNRSEVSLKKVLANALAMGKRRPIIIQSLFPLMDGKGPSPEEIEQYVRRLGELKVAGAQIAMVQVYSAHRPPHHPNCEHLPLKDLSAIARRVRTATGLRAEVF
jgi:wyosine [tRNA(Phe)-imidazoG37] synthetase (radical SAM superfamily)